MTVHTLVCGATGLIYNSADYVEGAGFVSGDTLVVSSGEPEAASSTRAASPYW